MAKFGIGVISTMERSLKDYMEHISHPTTFELVPDVNRRGVAPTRNRALKALYDAGCEYIVLFDDDCYPVEEGWQDFLLRAHRSSGSQVLMYPKDNHTSRGFEGDVEFVEWGIGAFTFLTRKAVETVGYFNTKYDTYGFEDVAYIARARHANLTPSRSFDTVPIGITDYIYSVDCDKTVQPHVTLDQSEKNRLIEKNKPVFDEELRLGVVHYPYDGGAD